VRRRFLAGTVVLAILGVEGKLYYYSLTRRDVRQTVQGLLLAERANLAGKRVYQDTWTRADRFVLEHVVGGHARQAVGLDGFVRNGGRGDYVIVPQPNGDAPEVVQVRSNRRHKLCRRAE
jgi:hypothetical protein